MSTMIFRNAEQAYRDWLAANPEGYVLNTRSPPTRNYMPLHRATCRTISEYTERMGPNEGAQDGALTERNYFKVCSTDPDSLLAWVRSQGGNGFTTICSRCCTDILNPPSPDDFDSQVSRARADSAATRRARLEQADRRPTMSVVSTVIFNRNPDVVAEVLERAAGVCEACKRHAPFKRKSDGSPYLEVHHRVRLADRGEDTVANAIAVCPNCHRKLHFGGDD